ncbi:hypothetical protein DICPUDRAFT_151839 [Dictyostelium purpureum]|uniref:Uncharacterized protein n=1 Tax=Dictyostelium purpureum TaxID=5786 RepID=F0ZJW1_DICPU|nr:uncharacterized protein DICPUDRAFT_151839 [Dictyostelium purpureum]EGC35750.1 hypothetical protein DICPUDRAFT_151839 [Dictyostelium purpureum]|eukprot:XP_003287702.1 hypothetical protein DICPUDRAFT_151839 [Dictyostelium purpureum]
MDYFNVNNNNVDSSNKTNSNINQSNKFNIKLVSKYKKRLDYLFNVLLVGEIFKSTNKHLLVGTADGKIKVYLNNEEIEVLETKGSSIQDLELLDTTKFGSIDVISGDSNGNMVIFSNHQILYRDTINGSITSIINHQLANGDFNLVVGDSLGLLTAIKPHQNALWRFKIPTINQTLNTLEDTDIKRINSHINIESIIGKDQDNINSITDDNSNLKLQQPSLHIRQIKSVQGYDIYNNKFHYVIICENAPFIHIVDHGKRLCSIPTPSPVNCMSVGYFTNSITSNDKLSPRENKNSANTTPTQIALGCENGYIYILTQDFKIEPYYQVGYPVTLLNKIKYSEINNKTINNNNNNNNNSNNNDNYIDDIDILICTGYFHSIKMYYNKNLICDHSLDDWVYTLSIGEVENNGDKTIVVGKLDNSIEYLKPIIIINK